MTSVLVSHENNKATYTVDVDYEVFKQAIDKVYKKTKNRYRIPGFRKGHAPRHIIELNYGKGVFYDDALNEVLPEAIERANRELKLEPIGRPDVDIKEFEENKPIVFEVTTQTLPHPELGDYSSIEVVNYSTEVEEEEVNRVIDEERKKNSVQREVEDRPAQLGDEVTIDFEGTKDGVAFEGGAAKGHRLELGSNSFIPGFEDAIVGHSVGEEFDIDVTFPENYGVEDLAGKDAKFHINLHSISEKEVPELDDDFAQDVSEFDTLEEYRKSVREKLEETKKKEVRARQENEAIERLIEISNIEAPSVLVDEQVEREIRDMAGRFQQMGVTLDQYLEYTGQNMDKLKEQHRPAAELRVCGDLALASLIDKEQISYTEEELEEEIRRLAGVYGAKDVDDFIKRVHELGNEDMVAEDLKKRKAIDRLMEVVKYVEPKEEETSEDQE